MIIDNIFLKTKQPSFKHLTASATTTIVSLLVLLVGHFEKMALAEFLKHVDLEEMAKSTTKRKNEESSTENPSDNPVIALLNASHSTAQPGSSATPTESTEDFLSSDPASQTSRRRTESPPQTEHDRQSKRRSASAIQSRQRLHGLIDELWELVPQEQRLDVRDGHLLSRVEKIERAIGFLKRLREQAE